MSEVTKAATQEESAAEVARLRDEAARLRRTIGGLKALKTTIEKGQTVAPAAVTPGPKTPEPVRPVAEKTPERVRTLAQRVSDDLKGWYGWQ